MASKNIKIRVLAIILCLSLIVQIFNTPMMKVKAADEIYFNWKQGSSITNKLEIQSETHDDEALFYWDLFDSGTYTLDYFLKDKSKVEVNIIKIDDDTLNLEYRIFQYDDINTEWVNITENVSSDYQEVDYVTSPVTYILEDDTPNLIDMDPGVDDDYALYFEDVTKGGLFPGATFKMNGQTVHFMWNDVDDRFYFETDSIGAGRLTPFVLSFVGNDATTKGPYIIEVLTKLDEFDITPTHYYIDGTIKNKNIIDDIDTLAGTDPGSSPGFDLTFEHPMVWDYVNHVYVEDTTDIFKNNGIVGDFYISEYGSTDISTSSVIQLDRDNANSFFDVDPLDPDDDKRYTMKLVADSTVADFDLNDEYIKWDNLRASTIYEVDVYIKQVQGQDESNNFDRTVVDYDNDGTNDVANVQFKTYIPEGGYAYTYLDYAVKRESIDEAYLEVKPYKGIENDIIKYDVYISPEKAWLKDGEEIDTEKWLTYTHEIGSEPYEGNLYIPVRFDGGSGLYYKIKISFDGQQTERKLYTQMLHYTSQPDELVPPPITKIDSITDIKVLPSDTGSVDDPPAQITMDVAWVAPDETTLLELLGKGDLYYELLMNEEPQNGTGSAAYEVVKVFKVTLEDADTDGNVDDVVVTEATGASTGSSENYYSYGYNKDNNTFRINDIIIKSKEANPNDGWMKVYTVNTNEEIENGDYDDIIETANEYKGVQGLPNVNFLRMRSVYMRDVDENDVYEDGSYSNLSIAKGLSLSHTAVGVPAVTNLEQDNIMTGTETIKFELQWDIADIRNFNEYMLKPVQKQAEEVYYEIYLSQDKDQLEDLNLQNYEVDNTVDTFTKYVDASNSIPTVDLSDQIVNIRNGDVIALKVKSNKNEYLGTEKIYIEGLDTNQVYYIKAVTRIEIADDMGVSTGEVRRSEESELLSFTTLDTGGDIQLMPLVPEDFSVIEILSGSTIKLGWTINMEELEADETIGYEIVRVEGRELNNTFSATTPQEDMIESSEDIIGWRIINADGNGYVMEAYNTETDTWDSVVGKHDITLGNVSMIDENLEPNKIYYYYLRAVRVDLNQTPPIDRNKPASEWTALTYTSDPLQAPINLTQEFYEYDFDKYDEAVIYFDVAIPEAGAANYIPEIYIYSQDDSNYGDQYHLVTDYDLESQSSDGAPDGFVRYYYTIEELNPGKNYSIKVRVRTNEENPNYSSYSERIIIRTEYDEDTYKRENLLNYYLDYYDQKTDELYKTIYWVAEDDSESMELKYREYYASDEMRSSINGEYTIDVSGYEDITIFLPNALVDVMEEEGIQFTIESDSLSITLNEDTLKKSRVDAFEEIIEEVEDSSSLSDYFVKMELDFREYKNKINGQTPASNMIKINIELVASDNHEINLEEQIYSKLESLIRTHRISVELDLVTELNETVYEEDDLLAIVDKEVEEIREDHASYVKGLMDGSIDGNPMQSIYELNQAMTIALDKDNQGLIALYKRNANVFSKLNTQNNTFEIYTNVDTIGEYIFAGFSKDELVNDSIRNADQINDLLIKYNLTDFFTVADLSDVSQEIRKYTLINSIARILGAPKDVNAVEWLRAKGFEGIDNKHIYDSMAKDEAYYLLVQCYAYKADIDLASIRISNYYAIKDIDNTPPDYKNTLLRGAELGIIELDRGYLNPRDNMSIEECLITLIKIEYKNW